MGGVALRQYEDNFARMIGAARAFGFWKGRVAFYAILRSLDIGAGDEVILPGYTCVMAVNPIIYLGAKPIFVDIDPATYNINADLIEEKLTPSTKLIIAQHTYGIPADMDAIMAIADRRGVPVVEDCCLSLGSEYDGRLTGTIGIASYFSFQWNKPYTSGLGGMAVTRDPALADRLEALQRQAVPPGLGEVLMLGMQLAAYRTLIYPWTSALGQHIFRVLTRMGLVIGSSSTGEYTPLMADDFFKGMSGSQARAGSRQLRRLDENKAHRRRIASAYDRLLVDHGWSALHASAKTQPTLVRYPVRVADKNRALTDAVHHFVELGSWFECPLHPIETPMEACGYESGSCPEAERASREVVNLSVHPRAGLRAACRTVDFIVRIGPARSSGDGDDLAWKAPAPRRFTAEQRREAAAVGKSWFLPVARSPRTGWLVYSLDFTIAMLQGCVAEPHRVRKTPAWMLAGAILRAVMALVQVAVMIMAWIPVASWLMETIARTFTRNPAGFFLRSSYWKARLKHLGTDTLIDQNVDIWGAANVSIGSHSHIDTSVRLAAGERRHGQRGSINIGNHVHLGPGVHIAGRGGVQIGDFVGVSANTHLYSATNTIQRPEDPGQLISMSHMAPHDQQHVIERPIIVEDYAFIGLKASIMPGVRIGRGAVIHANAEVTRSVPPYANIGGIARGRQIGWRMPRRPSPKLAPEQDEPRDTAPGATNHDG